MEHSINWFCILLIGFAFWYYTLRDYFASELSFRLNYHETLIFNHVVKQYVSICCSIFYQS